MSKKLLTILSVSAVAIGTAACTMPHAASPTDKAPGTYKSTSESTNRNGTTTSTEQITHVYRDSNGNKRATVKTETERDPKGLMNKSEKTTVKNY